MNFSCPVYSPKESCFICFVLLVWISNLVTPSTSFDFFVVQGEIKGLN